MDVISFERLARNAYDAHGRELAERIGGSQRPWDKLSPLVRASWIAVVRQVAEDLKHLH
jgi:hypothetical protein